MEDNDNKNINPEQDSYILRIDFRGLKFTKGSLILDNFKLEMNGKLIFEKDNIHKDSDYCISHPIDLLIPKNSKECFEFKINALSGKDVIQKVQKIAIRDDLVFQINLYENFISVSLIFHKFSEEAAEVLESNEIKIKANTLNEQVIKPVTKENIWDTSEIHKKKKTKKKKKKKSNIDKEEINDAQIIITEKAESSENKSNKNNSPTNENKLNIHASSTLVGSSIELSVENTNEISKTNSALNNNFSTLTPIPIDSINSELDDKRIIQENLLTSSSIDARLERLESENIKMQNEMQLLNNHLKNLLLINHNSQIAIKNFEELLNTQKSLINDLQSQINILVSNK